MVKVSTKNELKAASTPIGEFGRTVVVGRFDGAE